MKRSTILFTVIPVLAFFTVIFINPKDVANKRVNLDAVSVYTIDTGYTSKLLSENFDLETRVDVPELEIETLSEGISPDKTALPGGRQVKLEDKITVAYRGWRAVDGFIFDSSLESSPVDGITFNLAGLITGWEEGIVGMQVGEVRRIFIPSDKAYGETGSGEAIPANTDLIFDVELLGIN
jgi:FKBP-type peptidyl-prolyl cis-trans isomerase